MENNNPVVNPMSGFIISEATWLTNLDTQLFTTLYQPIVGPKALALLNTLWELIDEQPMLSKRWLHNELMSMVNLGPTELIQARQKLEAVGLIDTWHNIDSLGEYYVYQLNAPLQPADFFNDELMSALLLDSVGQQLYQRFREKFKLRKLENFSGENITKKVTDIFNPSRQAFKDIEKLAYPPLETATSKNNQDLSLANDKSFDFELLFDSVKSIGISYEELDKHRNAFYIQHELYQINELNLADYIRQTYQLDTKKINIEKIKFKISEDYQIKQQLFLQKAKPKNEVKPLSNSDEHQDYNAKNLIKIAQQLNPLDFLQSIKHKKNGFVTSNEQQTITQLVEFNLLPAEVINILIFYILIGLKKDNITRAYFNSLANTLSQHRVESASAAITELKQNRNKRQTETNRYNRPVKKVEKKPVYKVNNMNDGQLSDHDLAATQAKLAKLKSSRLTKKDE